MRFTDLPTDYKPQLITSLAFGANQLIPVQYTCEGKDILKVYALDALLKLPAKTTKKELEQTMGKHSVAFGELIGMYKRQRP
jgi:phosphatidylethanolamine-binding protein (PEBP) family uncharacterized protein